MRYPRGKGHDETYKAPFKAIEIGKGQVLRNGKELAFIGVGPLCQEALEAANALEKDGANVSVVNMRFVKPLDTQLLDELSQNHSIIITVEDGTVLGGFGSAVAEYLSDQGYVGVVKRLGIPDEVVEHGSPDELYKKCGLHADSLAKKALQLLKKRS